MSRVCVRVRSAELGDVLALVALLDAAEPVSAMYGERALRELGEQHLVERLSEIVRSDTRAVLVAIDEFVGDIVGLLVAKHDEMGAIEVTPVLHVTHLLVAPRSRRRGVGRTLLAAAVRLADERGMDRVLATAASGSREANRYLARLGFAPMVVDRVAPTSVLRRSLGMAEMPERIAVLRRARLARTHRAGFGYRAVRRGA